MASERNAASHERAAHQGSPEALPAPSLLKFGSTNFVGRPYQIIALGCALAIVISPCVLNAYELPVPAIIVHDVFVVCLLLTLLQALARVLWVVASLRGWIPGSKAEQPAGATGAGSPFHVVVIAMCNEPDDILLTTLASIDRQPNAGRISVVIGMEEKTLQKEERTEKYRAALRSVRSLDVYTHPSGLPGEVPGHGSNETWAAQRFAEQVLPERGEQPSQYCYTACDCDTLFVEGHFRMLDERFESYLHTRRPVLWQGFPVYHWHQSCASFAANAKAMFVTMWWVGIASAVSCNGFSCLSVPFEVVQAAGYKHPGYVTDDTMIVLQSSIVYQCPMRVELMPIPFYNTPTLGSTWWVALKELAKQDTRWHSGMLETLGFYWAHYRCSVQLCSWTLKTFWIRILLPMTGLFFISIAVADAVWGSGDDGLALEPLHRELHSAVLLLRQVSVIALLPFVALLDFLITASVPERPPGRGLSWMGFLGKFLWLPIYFVIWGPPLMILGLFGVILRGRAASGHVPALKALNETKQEPAQDAKRDTLEVVV